MPDSRRVVTYDGCGELFLEAEPLPPVGDHDVLVDVAASLLSAGTQGSHVQWRRENPDSEREDSTIGYQVAGRVVETGTGVERFDSGDRVACVGGSAIQATYDVVPKNLCVALPESVSFAEGACGMLACTGLNGVHRGDPDPGAAVAVVGLGIVGQMTAQIASIAGCDVLASDLYELRADTAATVGIEQTIVAGDRDLERAAWEFTDGAGLDCGFMCIGGDGTEPFEQLHPVIRPGPDCQNVGVIVMVGGAELSIHWRFELGNIDLRNVAASGPGLDDPAYRRGRDYPPNHVRWTTNRNLQQIVDWVADGALAVEPLLTDRFPIDCVDDAYDQVLQAPSECLGVLLTSDCHS